MSEKTAWRECPLNPRQGYIGEHLRRQCPLPSAMEHYRTEAYWCSDPETCARCPVLAFVAAVRAAKEFIASDVVQGAFVLQAVHGEVVPWQKDGKEIDEWLDAALAVLPKEADRG